MKKIVLAVFLIIGMVFSRENGGNVNCRYIGNKIPSNLRNYSAISEIKSSPSSYKCIADNLDNGDFAVVAYNKYPSDGELTLLFIYSSKGYSSSPCKDWGFGDECGVYVTKHSYGYSTYFKDKYGNGRVGNTFSYYEYNKIEPLVKRLFD